MSDNYTSRNREKSNRVNTFSKQGRFCDISPQSCYVCDDPVNTSDQLNVCTIQ